MDNTAAFSLAPFSPCVRGELHEMYKSGAPIPWGTLGGVGAKFGLKSIPILGNILSGGSALYNALKGNWGSAALDAAGMIPVAGNILNVGRGVHAAGTALTAARGLGRAGQAAARMAPAVTAGARAAAPIAAPKTLSQIWAGVRGLPAGASSALPKPILGMASGSAAPAAAAATAAPGFGSKAMEALNKYSLPAFGALDLYSGNKVTGLTGLASAIPGPIGQFASKAYMPIMLGNYALQTLRGGGGAETAAAQSPQVAGQFWGQPAPQTTQQMFQRYAYPSKAGNVEDEKRRLAFEVGVERFCKEANFDEEDQYLMLEFAKSGAFGLRDILGGWWDLQVAKPWQLAKAVGNQIWTGKPVVDTYAEQANEARLQAERRRTAEGFGATIPKDQEISGDEMAAISEKGQVNVADPSVRDTKTIQEGITKQVKRLMLPSEGAFTADQAVRTALDAFGQERHGATGQWAKSTFLNAGTPGAAPGAVLGGATPPPSPAALARWTPRPIEPMFGKSVSALRGKPLSGQASLTPPPAQTMGAEPSKMPSPGNPSDMDESAPTVGQLGGFSAPAGVDVKKMGKGFGAVWGSSG